MTLQIWRWWLDTFIFILVYFIVSFVFKFTKLQVHVFMINMLQQVAFVNTINQSNVFVGNTIGCHFRCCCKNQCLVSWKSPSFKSDTLPFEMYSSSSFNYRSLCSLIIAKFNISFAKKYQPPSILALKAEILIFKKILYYKRVFKHISFMGNIVWKAS